MSKEVPLAETGDGNKDTAGVDRHRGMGSDGSHFFSDRGKRSDAYRVSVSDEGQINAFLPTKTQRNICKLLKNE